MSQPMMEILESVVPNKLDSGVDYNWNCSHCFGNSLYSSFTLSTSNASSAIAPTLLLSIAPSTLPTIQFDIIRSTLQHYTFPSIRDENFIIGRTTARTLTSHSASASPLAQGSYVEIVSIYNNHKEPIHIRPYPITRPLKKIKLAPYLPTLKFGRFKLETSDGIVPVRLLEA